MIVENKFMERAIALARHGLGFVSPNPMVGAVIVSDGMVIGEGWHRCYGEGHAEVNAIASVTDKSKLSDSTIYVTLEPCSHYGKTPPCAKQIIDSGIPRVVVGSADPFSAVSGRGIAMLRDAGIEVEVGVMEEECRDINPFFMTAHSLRRPWVTLKWAQSADGYIDCGRTLSEPAAKISTQVTSLLVHRLRSLHDAILVGSGTMLVDRPSLTVRQWPGRSPRRYVADRSGAVMLPDGFTRLDGATPGDLLSQMYADGVTSVLVEGGCRLLQSFINAGLFDYIRVETALGLILGGGVAAPVMTGLYPAGITAVDSNRIDSYGRVPWFAALK